MPQLRVGQFVPRTTNCEWFYDIKNLPLHYCLWFVTKFLVVYDQVFLRSLYVATYPIGKKSSNPCVTSKKVLQINQSDYALFDWYKCIYCLLWEFFKFSVKAPPPFHRAAVS